MKAIDSFMTILLVGAVGGIAYTVVRNPDGVKAFFDGLNGLYGTAVRGTYGQA